MCSSQGENVNLANFLQDQASMEPEFPPIEHCWSLWSELLRECDPEDGYHLLAVTLVPLPMFPPLL